MGKHKSGGKRKVIGYAVAAGRHYHVVGPADSAMGLDYSDPETTYIWAKRSGAQSWIDAREKTHYFAGHTFYRITRIVRKG